MASYFGDFQPHQLDLVLSVPYRIGVWISHIDDVAGTARDDTREDMALGHVLNRLHDAAGHDSFVHDVLHEIIAHKDQWETWEASSANALDDISRARDLVDSLLPKPEALAYRKCIFHIAKAVAMAANEKADLAGGGLLAKVTDWLSAKSDDDIPANISPAESTALKQLLQRLKA